MRVRGSNNVGRAVQIIVALRFGDHGTNKCWELLVQKFDRFQTLGNNNSQQHATGCANRRYI